MKQESQLMKRTAVTLCFLLSTSLLIVSRSNIDVNASPTTWIVDDDGPADFHTINEAMSAASDGDTILVFSGNYEETLFVEKSLKLIGQNENTTVIQGSGTFAVVHITANNVILANFTVQNGTVGVLVEGSYNSRIVNNVITNNADGVWELLSNNGAVSDNTVTYNEVGIFFDYTNSTLLNRNIIADNTYGIDMENCMNTTIIENMIASSNFNGIFTYHFDNSTIFRNRVYNNAIGIHLESSNNNTIYQNNLLNNTNPAHVEGSKDNVWNKGWEGNFWSNYNGTDSYSGPYQNETGSDGIGDIAYIIDQFNQDNYPLMKSYSGPHDIGITNVTTSKTIVGQGYKSIISTKIINYGINTETFSITAYANTTVIDQKQVTLASRNSTTTTFTWNTSGFAKGSYVMSAYAWPVPGETDKTDNTYIYGTVLVTVVGDVSGDHIVDIDDLLLIIYHWGTHEGGSSWNGNMDLSNDSVVDIDDLVILVYYWGSYW